MKSSSGTIGLFVDFNFFKKQHESQYFIYSSLHNFIEQ